MSSLAELQDKFSHWLRQSAKGTPLLEEPMELARQLRATSAFSLKERLRVYQHTISNGTLTEQISARIGESATVFSVNWHPSGNYLAVWLSTSSGTEIRIYSFDKNTITFGNYAQLNWASSITEVRWSHDGNYLAVADTNNVVSIYRFTRAPFVLDNVMVLLNSDCVLTVPMTCYGQVEIDGQGHIFDISTCPGLTIASGSTLTLKNMIIKGISESNIGNADNSSILRLQNVRWIQSGNYQFTQGSLTITDNVLMTGASNFVYQSSQTSTINAQSQLLFDSGMTLSYAPSSAANNLFNFYDQSSQLYLRDVTLCATTTGLQLTKGSLIVEGVCSVLSDAIMANQGIQLGDGSSALNNIAVIVLPESGFNVNSGFLLHNNV